MNNIMNGSQFDIASIKALYSNHDLAKAAFDYWASCKYSVKSTSVNNLRGALQKTTNRVWGSGEIRSFLRKLQELKLGKFKVGRRGKETRLHWFVQFVDLGKAATGESVQIGKRTSDDPEEAVAQTPVAQPETGDMRVPFPLRPDRSVEIVVPKNLTTREAHRLAEFIKALPFEGNGHDGSPAPG